MDEFITIYYWIRLAVLVVVTLLSLATAIRMSGRRTYRSWREVLFALMAVALYVVLSAVVGVHYGPVWAAVLAVLGLVAGFFANRGERLTSEGGRALLRRSPVGPWVWFAAVVFATATLLFAEPYLFALSMLLLAFAVGTVVGGTIAVLMGAKDTSVTAPEASAA
jgi:hypothetical protein